MQSQQKSPKLGKQINPTRPGDGNKSFRLFIKSHVFPITSGGRVPQSGPPCLELDRRPINPTSTCPSFFMNVHFPIRLQKGSSLFAFCPPPAPFQFHFACTKRSCCQLSLLPFHKPSPTLPRLSCYDKFLSIYNKNQFFSCRNLQSDRTDGTELSLSSHYVCICSPSFRQAV